MGMTSHIILQLDHDSIRLLQRAEAGDVVVGRVPLDAPDFGDKLAEMRADLGPRPVDARVMLPPSLVLFLDAGDADDAEVEARVAERTPCPLDELVIARSNGLAAAVEQVTLDEARQFAREHGFNPTSYSACRNGAAEEVVFDDSPAPLEFRSKRTRQKSAGSVASMPAPLPTIPANAAATPPIPAPSQATADAAGSPTSAMPPRHAGVSAPPTRRAPAGPSSAGQASATPAASARSEAEALTIFGAREREPEKRRTLTPLHAAAAVLAVAALLAAYAFVGGEPEEAAIVSLEESVETTLDPVLESQPDAGEAIAALDAPPAETEVLTPQSVPDAAGDDAAPRIGDDAVPHDTPGSLAASPPDLPTETALAAPSEVVAPASPAAQDVLPPVPPRQPPPPGSVYDMDERGLVRPSEEGSPTPQGVLVHSGPPPVVPPRPATVDGANTADPPAAGTEEVASLAAPEAAAPEAAAPAAAPPDIVRLRPRDRPAALEVPLIVVTAEPAAADTPKPLPRPSAVAVASAAAANSTDFDALARQARGEAAAASPQLAATRATEPPPEAPVGQANVAVQPSLPTRASVSERATIANAIQLERVNLIGVYGSPSDRRALIRLPTGRYIKVKVGDRVDGGRVAAIEASSVQYVKGGRRYALTMPNG